VDGLLLANDEVGSVGDLPLDPWLLCSVKLGWCRTWGVRGLLTTAMTCDDIKTALVAGALCQHWAASSKRSADDQLITRYWPCSQMLDVKEWSWWPLRRAAAVALGRFFIGHVAPMKRIGYHVITTHTCWQKNLAMLGTDQTGHVLTSGPALRRDWYTPDDVCGRWCPYPSQLSDGRSSFSGGDDSSSFLGGVGEDRLGARTSFIFSIGRRIYDSLVELSDDWLALYARGEMSCATECVPRRRRATANWCVDDDRIQIDAAVASTALVLPPTAVFLAFCW